MKKTIILFALVISSFFVLTACFGNNGQTQLQAQPQNLALNADSILDNQIYQSAVEANDTKQCAKIKDAKIQSECKNVIDANLLTLKAVKALDKSICDKIELDRYKSNCIETTDAQKLRTEQNKVALENITKIRSEDEEIFNNAQKAKDIEICRTISDVNMESACETQITLNKAIELKDVNICDNLKTPNQLQICKDLFVEQ